MATPKKEWPFPTFGFTLSVEGDMTGTKHDGNFEAKERLSHRDMLQRDAMRRNLLGDRPETAPTFEQGRAQMLAHLAISLVDAPKWWRDSDGGLDLYDSNVVVELYEKVMDGQNKAVEAIIKKGEEAKAKLEKKAKAKELDAE